MAWSLLIFGALLIFAAVVTLAKFCRASGAPGIDLFVRRVEEPRTAARLGEAYRQYLQRVPRWRPKKPEY